MGKTVGCAVWLDPNKTTPFEFYQYWRNLPDADVLTCLRMLTFLPLEQIEEMSSWEGAKLNEAKEILAMHLTELVHGKEEAKKANAAGKSLFTGGGDMSNVPTYILRTEDYRDGTIDLSGVLVVSGLSNTRSEARRNIEQGGVSIEGEVIKDVKKTFTKEDFAGEGLLIKRGKKNFCKVKSE